MSILRRILVYIWRALAVPMLVVSVLVAERHFTPFPIIFWAAITWWAFNVPSVRGAKKLTRGRIHDDGPHSPEW